MFNRLLLKIYVAAFLVQTYFILCIPAYSLHEFPSAYTTDFHNKSAKKTSTIHVVEGQTFSITLDYHASAGSTWYMTQPALEDTVQLLSKTIMPYRHPGEKTRIAFKFKALQPGEETIKLEYAHPWSWYSEQIYTYTVIIHNKNRYQNENRPVPAYKITDWLPH